MVGLAVISVVGAACGNGQTPRRAAGTVNAANPAPEQAAVPVIDPGDGGTYQPKIDPANFVAAVDNPYLPLTVGSKWVYEGTHDGEPKRIEIVVTPERRTIMGISAVVVRDTVFVKGAMVEDTYDWYAQDRDGNVWYLGEDSGEYENGRLVSKESSWEAGVSGARPGIIMPAAPTVGRAYRQEYLPGAAEGMAEVIRIDSPAGAALGRPDHVVVTREWSPLEPETIEEKSYAPGVGMLVETQTAGGESRHELVEFSAGH